jgi:hypothetical protein
MYQAAQLLRSWQTGYVKCSGFQNVVIPIEIGPREAARRPLPAGAARTQLYCHVNRLTGECQQNWEPNPQALGGNARS